MKADLTLSIVEFFYTFDRHHSRSKQSGHFLSLSAAQMAIVHCQWTCSCYGGICMLAVNLEVSGCNSL